MYLLLYEELDKSQRDWLTRNALAVAPLAWVHNAHVKGTIAIRLDKEALKDLEGKINHAATSLIMTVEEQIKKTSLRGRAKSIAINRLNLVVQASSSLELINYAKDLLIILGESVESNSVPDEIKKEEHLGIDVDTVRDYILRLAKKPSIH